MAGKAARGRWRCLGAAALLLVPAATWLPRSASAQTEEQCTPTILCSTVFTASTSEELVFNAPVVVTNDTSSFQTELIGKLSGGTPLYDQTFYAPFNDPLVQSGVVRARLAITTAGGPGVVFLGPSLTRQTVTVTSNSITTYSLNHAVVTTAEEPVIIGDVAGIISNPSPWGSTVYLNGVAIGTNVDGTLVETVVNGAVVGPTPTYYAGARSTCAGSVDSLPSTVKPTCTTGGTPILLPGGATGLNVNTDTTDYIDQSTVTTTNTLTSSVYTLTGTVKPFGSVHAAVADEGFDAADRFGRRLLSAGPNGGEAGSAPGDPVWLEGYGFVTQTGAHGDFPGGRASGGGINGGLDYDFADGFKLGAAGDYDSADIDEASAGEHADLALTQFGVYGGWRSGGLYASLAGTYGWGQASSIVSPIGLMQTALSRTDVTAAGVSAEAGERIDTHGVALTPEAGAAWRRIDAGAFTETGSALDLTSPGRGYDRYQGWLGLSAETTLGVGPGGALTLRAYGRALALGGADVIALPVTFVGSATSLAIAGADTGSFGGDLGVSADWRIGHAVRAFAAYDARLRQRYSAQTGSLGLKVSF